jgi:mannose/cellobiose epimerase-like protein (N-acyl-D-glucosamine 2-epimerase family)
LDHVTGIPVEPRTDIAELLKKLPDGDRWVRHLREDLLPFWETKEALGSPVGNFPTYRCNDGTLYNPATPCEELANPDPSVKDIIKLDRDYVRMKARQVFAYGIAYHMTGKKEYLDLAQAGTNYLRKYALEYDGGKFCGAFSYFKEPGHVPSPAASMRTSQDMAYAVTGIGFYYYLTRDLSVLKDVQKLKNYIWSTYYDQSLDIVTWVKSPTVDGDTPNQLELVGQLDQVYGYMLWLAHAMPASDRLKWKADLTHLARIMIEQFFSPREGMFWGSITDVSKRQLGTDHTDFGHTVKTLWLIYEIGKLTSDVSLIEFGRSHAADILDKAYIKETGSWARRIDERGRLDEDKEWWILAELDQVAGTLGLIDPAFARYLPQTYDYWFKYMVDHDNHEIWHWVNAKDNKPNLRIPKQHSWKNALHSFEHALVGYMVGQQIHEKPVTLYFAFSKPPAKEEIQPYFFQGRVEAIERTTTGFKVTFTKIR